MAIGTLASRAGVDMVDNKGLEYLYLRSTSNVELSLSIYCWSSRGRSRYSGSSDRA